jgi:hypothetical protein
MAEVQVYLGGYSEEAGAAEAYDVAVLKCKGENAATNFPKERYRELLDCIECISVEDIVRAVRRMSQGFSRGSSTYRGVTMHPTGTASACSYDKIQSAFVAIALPPGAICIRP